MNDETKIHLSPFEKELLINSTWILTKNGIIKKTQRIFEELQEQITSYTASHADKFPSEVTGVSPKISRGENYQGLPWLMLDYPRYFNKENTFAIRTMFWWGNFFSTTLQLSGIYQRRYLDSILRSHEFLSNHGFYCCVSDHAWHHHFEPDNYIPIKDLSADRFAGIIRDGLFLKLSAKFSVTEWENAGESLSKIFEEIVECLG